MWAFRISNSQTYLDLIQIRHSRLNIIIISNILTVLLHPQAIAKTHAPIISLQWSRVTSSLRPHGTPSLSPVVLQLQEKISPLQPSYPKPQRSPEFRARRVCPQAVYICLRHGLCFNIFYDFLKGDSQHNSMFYFCFSITLPSAVFLGQKIGFLGLSGKLTNYNIVSP